MGHELQSTESVPPIPPPHYQPTGTKHLSCPTRSRELKCSSAHRRAIKKAQVSHGNPHVAEKVKSIAKIGDHKIARGCTVERCGEKLPSPSQGISESDSLKIVEPFVFMVPFRGWRGCGGACPRTRSRSPAVRGSRCVVEHGGTRCGGRVGVRGSVCGARWQGGAGGRAAHQPLGEQRAKREQPVAGGLTRGR
jgi:hypothetical protein